jgi:transcriptional regulator with XRE-family HTH domain
MRFKDMLREQREKAGLTQLQLAEKAGIPIGSLRNLEQGQRLPGWGPVVKLSKALCIPTDTFADCDEVNEPEPEPPTPKPGRKKGVKKK